MVITCKMCGGNIEFYDKKTTAVCEYCGRTTILPKISDEVRADAFNRGNHFRRIGEFDKAISVYERIVSEDETDAEAHWCMALSRFGIEYVKDPASDEYIPTCHRSSFDSFLEDVDYLDALKYADVVAREQYQMEGAEIARVQRDILTVVHNEDPFDVFICYKEGDENGQRTVDSTLAQDIYYQLNERGMRVFFARITLEDKAGRAYEPYIFSALNSAKVMVVVGTKPEYLNAVWVRNEWSRFLALMKNDNKKLLIPCYRGFDPYELPEQLSVLQSYDMSRIGFVQDLIRGVEKVVKGDKVTQTVIKEVSAAAKTVDTLLKRGNLALEDGDWDTANGFFEEALNLDPECAEAYIGQFIANYHCRSFDDYEELFSDIKYSVIRNILDNEKKGIEDLSIEVDRHEKIYIKQNLTQEQSIINQYSLYVPEAEIIEILYANKCHFSYAKALKRRIENVKVEITNDKFLQKAQRFGNKEQNDLISEMRKNIFKTFDKGVEELEIDDKEKIKKLQEDYDQHLIDAEEQVRQLYNANLNALEAKYQEACQFQEQFMQLKCPKKEKEMNAYIEKYKADCTTAQRLFNELGYYKDSTKRAVACYEEGCRKAKFAKKKLNQFSVKYFFKILFIVLGSLLAAFIAFCIVLVVWLKVSIEPEQKNQALLIKENHEKATQILSMLDNNRGAYQMSIISSGDNNSAAIKSDGTVVVAGNNNWGQCDTSDWSDIISVCIGAGYTVGLKSDGTVVAVGKDDCEQCDVLDWKNIISISAGTNHTVGLKSNGTVVAVGDNAHSQCDVSNWKDIIAVSAGKYYTIGLKSDGTVVTAGNNTYSQCNVSDWENIVAVSAGKNHTVGLKSDGTVIATGSDNYNMCDVSDWNEIVSISAGENYTTGLKSDGTVVAVGFNRSGQCDVLTWNNIIAVSAGKNYTMGLKSNGTIVITGNVTNDMSNVSTWTDIMLLEID